MGFQAFSAGPGPAEKVGDFGAIMLFRVLEGRIVVLKLLFAAEVRSGGDEQLYHIETVFLAGAVQPLEARSITV